MNILKPMLPYIGANSILFYALPFFIRDTGSAMFLLLFIIPYVCFFLALLYGRKQGFHWQYAILIMILFAPTVFIFYNISAAIYIGLYGVIACMGNAVGYRFCKSKNASKE